MKKTGQLYDVLARHSVHNLKKMRKALADTMKHHKVYMTDGYTYIAKVSNEEKNDITKKLKECSVEVNGRLKGIIIQYNAYREVEPKKPKTKKPSNNNKNVAAKAKKARKDKIKATVATRKKGNRPPKKHHFHQGNGTMSTLDFKRYKRAKKAGKAVIKLESRKPVRAKKKALKSKVSKPVEQTLKFAA